MRSEECRTIDWNLRSVLASWTTRASSTRPSASVNWAAIASRIPRRSKGSGRSWASRICSETRRGRGRVRSITSRAACAPGVRRRQAGPLAGRSSLERGAAKAVADELDRGGGQDLSAERNAVGDDAADDGRRRRPPRLRRRRHSRHPIAQSPRQGARRSSAVPAPAERRPPGRAPGRSGGA